MKYTFFTLLLMGGMGLQGQDVPKTEFVTIPMLQFSVAQDAENKRCLLEPHTMRVICTGTLLGVIGIWEEPVVFPASATVTISVPEAIDVPAIMETVKEWVGDDSDSPWCTDSLHLMPRGCSGHIGLVKEPACADKSRILLHSEDGKFYCHKPQTD